MTDSTSKSSRLMKKGWLLLILFAGFLPLTLWAHPSPNTLVFLDISSKRVTMEIQLPVPELELAFGHAISKDPETLIERSGPQVKEYLAAHIHAYVSKDRPWQVVISRLKMDKGKYADSNIPYWEVNAEIVLLPQPNDDTRKFFLDYDVIMHQVINHIALVSIRSDWETGNLHSSSAEATVIRWNLKDNVIPPLQINLEEGSWWKGFKSMLGLGIEHIREGTDHLMFLLVLLLPAPLVVRGKEWGTFGGIKYSIVRLLKIVTAFTIGHSITLVLGSLGWVRLPSQPIEILIAFSIFISAIHALRPLFPGKEIFIAGGFGLIHGLAFASTLANLNLDAGAMALSILGFNIGIEVMQLFVIAVTVPWLIVLSRTKWYEFIRTTGALFAAIAALAWMLQRYLNKENFLSSAVEGIAKYAAWAVIALALVALCSLWGKQTKPQKAA